MNSRSLNVTKAQALQDTRLCFIAYMLLENSRAVKGLGHPFNIRNVL
jgi:hypothetical protein